MVSFNLATEQQSWQMAAALAAVLRGGEFIALRGELGAGKSSFARAAIRALAGDSELEVPSPSFTLVQSYVSTGGLPIYHCDLYRISDPREIFELGLEPLLAGASRQNSESAIYFVEWPQLAAPLLRQAELDLEFSTTISEHIRVVQALGKLELIEALANYAR